MGSIDKERHNDVLMAPLLQNAANRYQVEQEKWRKLAVEEKDKERRNRYLNKTRGQWNIAQYLGKKGIAGFKSCQKGQERTRR